MKRASFIILIIMAGILSNAQEKSRTRIPISFNIDWTYHYHVQQVYPGMKFKTYWDWGQIDVSEEVPSYQIDYSSYKPIKISPESSWCDMWEYSEHMQGFKVEADIQPYKFINLGLGFQYSPNARDRYSYYLKLGSSLSARGNRFYYSPHVRVGGRKYKWYDLQQDCLFVGIGIDLDIVIIKDFLLNITFSGDWYQNYEYWKFVNWTPRPAERYYAKSRNDNWIITGSLGVKYKIFDN